MSARWPGRFVSGPVGSIAEAWAELRTHKLRVFLSLVGIAVAVAALTAVLALGEYQKQTTVEQSDRWGGRVATIQIQTLSTNGGPVDQAEIDRRFERVAERYHFSHTTRFLEGSVTLPVQLTDGVTPVATRLMDPDWPVIHRQQVLTGRWFAAQDRELLAPPVVISEELWSRLGSPDLRGHPTLRMTGNFAGVYPVIGVTPRDGEWDTELRVDMLFDQYLQRVGELPNDAQAIREVWVGADLAEELGPVLAMDLRSDLPPDQSVTVNRSDWAAHPDFETGFLVTQLITGAISGIILLLGGLSLLNIQLVAMRQRIREIGIRRSFGASSGRIFFSVMLESVVATTVAGLCGIVFAVAIMRSPLVMSSMFATMQDVPPFPIVAAFIGLIASVAIGALAGLIPAIVANRVKVIDAIRF